MFFIDHDQPQVAERQIKGRACADDQLHIPAGRHFPAAASLGHGHAGMPFRRPRAKTRLDAGQKLGRQRNFGQEDKRLPAHRQTHGHRL